MNPSPRNGATAVADAREEVRRRFLALSEASNDGGPPPDIESLIADLPEPERSELRSELLSLSQSGEGRPATVGGASDGTVDHVPVLGTAPPVGATVDLAPDGTTDGHPAPAAPAHPGGTVDYAPDPSAAPEATVDHAPATHQPHGGTTDFIPGAESEAAPGGATVDHHPRPTQGVPPSGKKGKRPEAPQSVAGYEILSTLGRGAMGVVYKARQRGLNRLVALKMILSGDHAAASELTRFQAEAEAVAHLHHPNIVQIYEVGEEDGRPFFSLEFVDGSSLDKKVNGTPLVPIEAARLVQKLAEAMHSAHQNHIIHRDLKPSNVLLAQDGTPKIGDFGLAKRVDDDSGHTRTGTVLGTPSYMAPEQAEGRLQDVGPLSDQYSIGAILYELLTGRPPFKGSTILDTLQQVRTMEPVAPVEFQPGVPRDLETICLKCLQKDPARRYADAGALAADLGHFLAGEPIQARPVSKAERLLRWCKRNPRVAALTGAVVGLVLVSVIGLLVFLAVLKVAKDEAVTNANEADKQKGIALGEKAEADKQKGIAEGNEKIANQNEKRAKETSEIALRKLTSLGKGLYNSLRSQDLPLKAAPEMAKKREQVLAMLRQSLVDVSKQVERAGTTTFAEVNMCQELGDLLRDLGQTEEARRVYKQGYERVKTILEKEPNNDQARTNLSMMALRVGEIALLSDGDAATYRDRANEGREIALDTLKHPRGGQVKELDAKIAVSHLDYHMGVAHLALGQPATAREYLEEGLAYREEWVKAAPTYDGAKSFVMQSRIYLGIASSHLGDDKATREHFGKALEIDADFLKRIDPTYIDYIEDRADVQGTWGDALLRLGDTKEAAHFYEDSLKNRVKVIAAKPDDLSQQPHLALAHERLGLVDLRLNKREEAAKHFQEALKLRAEVWTIEKGNLTKQAAFVLAQARSGRYGDAAGNAAMVLPKVGNSTELSLQMARCYAVCAASNASEKTKYTEQALKAIRTAVGPEFKDPVGLLTDPDLETLRNDAGFKAIVDKIK